MLQIVNTLDTKKLCTGIADKKIAGGPNLQQYVSINSTFISLDVIIYCNKATLMIH